MHSKNHEWEEEVVELKKMLEENNIDISDMDDIISVARCSTCCSIKNGG